MDKQGRILIPNTLREYARLDKDAVLVGVDSRIEIWGAEAWQAHEQSMAEDYNAALMCVWHRQAYEQRVSRAIMVREVLSLLQPERGGIFVDGTARRRRTRTGRAGTVAGKRQAHRNRP
jgi:hypothetical protein